MKALRGSRPLGELELGFQVLHAPVALDAVTGPAQELQILQVIGAALCSGDDVIDFQVSRLEVGIAPGAVSSLDAVECLSVRSRDRERPRRSVRRRTSFLWTISRHRPCLSSIRDTTNSAALVETSIPVQFLPRSSAATHVVAHPQNGSSTISPSFELARMIRFKRAMGFCVG